VIAIGLGWSIVFLVVALHFELQLYADGAMFSYAVAVQDVWAFHWHNISARTSVFILTLLPAEIYVGLNGNPLKPQKLLDLSRGQKIATGEAYRIKRTLEYGKAGVSAEALFKA